MQPMTTRAILTLSAAALLLSGCGKEKVFVPAQPALPVCLVVPKALLEPIPGVLLPSPPTKRTRSEGMKCEVPSATDGR